MRALATLTLTMLLVVPPCVLGSVINVPGDYPTLIEAVQNANPAGGDTILVAEQTFTGSLTIDRPITIIGTGSGRTQVKGTNAPAILCNATGPIRLINILATGKTPSNNSQLEGYIGLQAIAGEIYLYSCRIVGGEGSSNNGVGKDGGVGLLAEDPAVTRLILIGSQVVGGKGGDYIDLFINRRGGNGANAVQIKNVDSIQIENGAVNGGNGRFGFNDNAGNGGNGIDIENCQNIAILGPNINAGSGAEEKNCDDYEGGEGGHGMRIFNSSNITVSSIDVTGGNGGKCNHATGGLGVWLNNVVGFTLNDATIAGGTGGTKFAEYFTPGGTGGHGMLLEDCANVNIGLTTLVQAIGGTGGFESVDGEAGAFGGSGLKTLRSTGISVGFGGFTGGEGGYDWDSTQFDGGNGIEALDYSQVTLSQYVISTGGPGNPPGSAFVVDETSTMSILGTASCSGTLYRDDDQSGARDPGEPGLSGWTIKITSAFSSGYAITDSGGHYSFGSLPGTDYELSLPGRPDWIQTDPPANGTHSFTLSTGQSLTGFDFGVFGLPPTPEPDLAVYLSGNAIRPGFGSLFTIIYENNGNTDLSPTIKLDLPGELIYDASYPPGTYDAGLHRVTWQPGLFPTGSTEWLYTGCSTPANVAVGTQVTASAVIEPVAGDATPGDNSDVVVKTVTGSSDPNRKRVTPEGFGPNGYVRLTDTLHYHIDFQNVGTDTAFNVVVRDNLDDDLDLNTIDNLTSSHPAAFAVEETDELVWTFQNILLPDSNVNETGSHGFVEFDILPKATLPVGRKITNDGDIYFDFNLPVKTNIVTSTIADTLGEIDVSPTSIDFETVLVGSTDSIAFTIKNLEWYALLEIDSLYINGVHPELYVLSGPSVPMSIDPLSQADYILYFTPTSTGVKTAAIRISSNDRNESMVVVNLTGKGGTAPAWEPMDTLAFGEDSGLQLDLDTLVSDEADPDSLLILSVVSDPELNAELDSTSHVLTLSAHPDFYGTANLTLQATDGDGFTSDLPVLVIVESVNDAPVFSPLPDIAFDEDQGAQLLLNNYVTDPDHDSTQWAFSVTVSYPASSPTAKEETVAQAIPAADKGTFTKTDQPKMTRTVTRVGIEGGSVVIRVGDDDLVIVLDSLTHVATFSSTTDSSGTFEVVFTVTDDSGATDIDTIIVTVNPVEDPPIVLNPIADQPLIEDQASAFIADLNQVFHDGDGDPLTFQASVVIPSLQTTKSRDEGTIQKRSAPPVESVSITVWIDSLGHLYAEPLPDAFGIDSVLLTATSGSDSAFHGFNVVVHPINDPPVRVGQIADTTFDENSISNLVLVTEIFFDVDGEILQYVALADTGLTFQITADSLWITPVPEYFGIAAVILTATDDSGASAKDTFAVTIDEVVGINDGISLLPKVFKLHQNYPNPFNPTTVIKYDLPEGGQVSVQIFNVLGQKVHTLINEYRAAGYHSVQWNGLNEIGRPVSSGIYIYRIEAGSNTRNLKMMLLR